MKKLIAMVMTVVMLLSSVSVAAVESDQPRDDADLNEALNIEGGTLSFTSPGEYPWRVEGDYAISGNRDVNSSSSIVSTVVNLEANEVLWFNYRVRSEENHDFLIFSVNGEEIMQWSGWMDGFETGCYRAEESGEYIFEWYYLKDEEVSYSWDTAYLDEVYVSEAVPVTGVTVDETVVLPGGMSTQLQYSVLPENAFDTSVSFASSNENVASVSETGVITSVSEGNAIITVTTNDGGFTAQCLVTVDDSTVYTQFYGYVQYDAFGESNYWCTFADFSPSIIEHYADGSGTNDLVPRAGEYVDGIIYGYNRPGSYTDPNGAFYMLDIATGEITYPGGDAGGRLVQDMAFDWTTETMYAITNSGNGVSVLCTVDLLTGTLTDIAPINTNGRNFWAFTFDNHGSAYVLAAGVDDYDRTDTGKLYSLNLETCECTLIGDTGVVLYFAQGLAFNHATEQLYWFNSYDESNGLYELDRSTGEVVKYYGRLMNGLTLQFMVIPNERSEYTLADVNDDGIINMEDAVLIARYSIGAIGADVLNLAAADVNADGSINMEDAVVTARIALNIA